MQLPDGLRQWERTSKGLDRINQELRRRFKVIGSFVNDAILPATGIRKLDRYP